MYGWNLSPCVLVTANTQKRFGSNKSFVSAAIQATPYYCFCLYCIIFLQALLPIELNYIA